MICSKCGNTISDDSLFCTFCGYKISPNDESKRRTFESYDSYYMGRDPIPSEHIHNSDSAEPVLEQGQNEFSTSITKTSRKDHKTGWIIALSVSLAFCIGFVIFQYTYFRDFHKDITAYYSDNSSNYNAKFHSEQSVIRIPKNSSDYVLSIKCTLDDPIYMQNSNILTSTARWDQGKQNDTYYVRIKPHFRGASVLHFQDNNNQISFDVLVIVY